MAKVKRRRHAFTIGLNKVTGKPVKKLIPCSNGRRVLDLVTTLDDVRNGHPGCVGSCAVSETWLRYSCEGRLPHPCYHTEMVHGYIYVVDKIDRYGVPLHCVRYRHSKSGWLDEFDRPGGKADLIRAWKDMLITFSPPMERGSQAGNGAAEGAEDGSRSSHRYMTKHRLKGALRRAKDAGLTFHDAA